MNKDMAELQYFILELSDMVVDVRVQCPDDKKLLGHIYRLMATNRKKLEAMRRTQRINRGLKL